MTKDNLFETSSSSLLAMAPSQDALHTWSEAHRRDYVALFRKRARSARFILLCTAVQIADLALSRKYISGTHYNKLAEKFTPTLWYENCEIPNVFDWPHRHADVGGLNVKAELDRDVQELITISEARAKAVLAELPPLRKAVAVIDPGCAKDMDKRDAILKRLEELRVQLVELSHPIKMSELDQDMTIGDFRALVKNNDKERRDVIEVINDLADSGSELEDKINKALYAGLPGLSDAVVRVVSDHLERGALLDQTARRIEEKVMFGDSQAAMDLLRHFEQDEVKVSDRIRSEFKNALQVLNLARTKRLAAKKGKKS